MTRNRTRMSLSIVATVFLMSCARSEAAPATPVSAKPVPVATVPVELTSNASSLEAVGTLGGKEELPLAFKIGGVVSRINAEAGQAVRAGAVLAELDTTEIRAEVRKAREALAKAGRDLARARELYRDSVATLEQLQDATTAFLMATSNVNVAEFNQQYAIVRAPADGIVVRRSIDQGQLLAPGVSAFLFRSEHRGVVLRAGLPDRDAVELRQGDAATVRFEAFPSETFRGRVTAVAVAATSGSGTYEVEVALETRGRVLASGLVGHVAFVPQRVNLAPSVPVTSLLEANGDSATLYTLSEDRRNAVRRRVRIGALVGDRVTVLGGLDRNAQVVTAGAAWLADGSPVQLSVAPSAASTPRKAP
jgi:RND family efflux transporter MFP subunit